jgi:hypothetical protein
MHVFASCRVAQAACIEQRARLLLPREVERQLALPHSKPCGVSGMMV